MCCSYRLRLRGCERPSRNTKVWSVVVTKAQDLLLLCYPGWISVLFPGPPGCWSCCLILSIHVWSENEIIYLNLCLCSVITCTSRRNFWSLKGYFSWFTCPSSSWPGLPSLFPKTGHVSSLLPCWFCGAVGWREDHPGAERHAKHLYDHQGEDRGGENGNGGRGVGTSTWHSPHRSFVPSMIDLAGQSRAPWKAVWQEGEVPAGMLPAESEMWFTFPAQRCFTHSVVCWPPPLVHQDDFEVSWDPHRQPWEGEADGGSHWPQSGCCSCECIIHHLSTTCSSGR